MDVNTNKLNQKSLLRTMILVFGLVCFFSVLTNAEGPKLPLPEEFDIFKIAVIGSDIENGTTIKFDRIGEKSLNEMTVDKLCKCKKYAKKLSDYEGVTTDGEEIVLYKERLPKNSFYYGKAAFSFYYVNNCDEAAKILPQCQIAICPFFADSKEIEGDLDECELKKHLIRLRDFVKHYQHMCEVRFLYYTDQITDPSELPNYTHSICDLCKVLYYNGEYGRDKWLQQDVLTNRLSTKDENSYDRCMEHIWTCKGTRAEEFKTWTGNDVLHVNKYEIEEKEAERIRKEKEIENARIREEAERNRKEEKAENDRIEKKAERIFSNFFLKYEDGKNIIIKVLYKGYDAKTIKEIFKSIDYQNNTIKIFTNFKRSKWDYIKNEFGWGKDYYDDTGDDYNKEFLKIYEGIFNDKLVHESLLKLITCFLKNNEIVKEQHDKIVEKQMKFLWDQIEEIYT